MLFHTYAWFTWEILIYIRSIIIIIIIIIIELLKEKLEEMRKETGKGGSIPWLKANNSLVI